MNSFIIDMLYIISFLVMAVFLGLNISFLLLEISSKIEFRAVRYKEKMGYIASLTAALVFVFVINVQYLERIDIAMPPERIEMKREEKEEKKD